MKYVFEQRGETKDRILFADLEVDDPYNTYRNAGLPPGPINNPGEAALRAALEAGAGALALLRRDRHRGQTPRSPRRSRSTEANVEIYQREVLGEG